jgi:hypothetical protein
MFDPGRCLESEKRREEREREEEGRNRELWKKKRRKGRAMRGGAIETSEIVRMEKEMDVDHSS